MGYTDPSGYATETVKKNVYKKRKGSKTREKVGETKTTTETDDDTGKTTSTTIETIMDNGSFSVTHISYSNGKADSATVAGGNYKAGTGASYTFDIGSQESVAKSSSSNNEGGDGSRAVSLTDSDGNAYGARIRQIWVGSPEGLWGLVKGVQGEGNAGYEAWASAGG